MKRAFAPACGLAYPILLILGDDVIAAVAGEAPGRGASPEQVASWAAASDAARFYAGRFIGGVLAPLALLIFVAYVASGLRRKVPGWRAETALSAGVLAAGLQALAVPLHFAAVRGSTDLDPAILVMLAVDLIEIWALGFAFLAVFLLIAGSVGVKNELMASWIGWSALVLGAGMLAGAFVSSVAETEVGLAFVPVALLWFIWLPAASISMMLRAVRNTDPAS